MSKSRSKPDGGYKTSGLSSPAQRRLIVNADDFGLSPGVNAGVIRAAREGILTSTTLLANALCFREAVALAAATPTLGVGLHLNLVRGRPVSAPGRIPLLVDAKGILLPFRWRRLSRAFLAQAEIEYRGQFEKILGAGIVPTHIDFEKHHGFQAGLYGLACRLAGEYGIPAVRNLREPLIWACRTMGWPGWRAFAMAAALRCGTDLLGSGSCRLTRPDRLLGQSHIGGMDETAWLRLLANLPDGTSEVMTHPGLPDEQDPGPAGEMGGSWLGTRRIRELEALLSPKVRQAVVEAGVQLMCFREL